MSKSFLSVVENLRNERKYIASITKLYFRHVSTLVAHYDEWKDKDEYYFIALGLDMAYVSTAFIVRIADPPYHLGTVIRTSLAHPDLFSCLCPRGHEAFAYTYAGSPLSGRVSQAMACPVCGWNEWIPRTGWMSRSKALKAVQAEDRKRLNPLEKERAGFKAADLRDLLRFLGVPENELLLPEIKNEIKRLESGDAVFYRDSYGGVKIEDTRTGNVTLYHWRGEEG